MRTSSDLPLRVFLDWYAGGGFVTHASASAGAGEGGLEGPWVAEIERLWYATVAEAADAQKNLFVVGSTVCLRSCVGVLNCAPLSIQPNDRKREKRRSRCVGWRHCRCADSPQTC